MRIHVRLPSILCLLVSSALGYQDETPHLVAEEVILMPVGPFGEPLSNCKLYEVLTRDNGRPVDRRGRFTGLVGRNIPFGTYVISLTCDVPEGVTSIRGGVASSREVHARNEFLVISSHRWLGDHGPDGGPRFRVNILKPDSSSKVWIKFVGLYLQSEQVAGVDETSSSAQIVDATPGDYLLILLKPGGIVCEKGIRLLDPSGSMTIDIGKACEIVDVKGVVDLSTPSKHP
jgi:hypothetical protein